MSFRTDYSRVAGLGSARAGARSWWMQRLTSIALLPLAFLFISVIARSLGASHARVLDIFAIPWNSVGTMLFIIVGFMHLRLGLHEVIEDYVHSTGPATALHVLNTLLCWAFAITGVFSVARMAFGIAG